MTILYSQMHYLELLKQLKMLTLKNINILDIELDLIVKIIINILQEELEEMQ